jgi:hypothetical protein
LQNHFPMNLSWSKSLLLSNNIGQVIYNPKFLIKIWVNTVFGLVVCSLLGTIFAIGYPLRLWLFRHANHFQWSWIHILDTTWQVANQNASKQSAWVTMVITRGMKRRTIPRTAGGIFLIWQQPISARDFRSALILTGCRDIRFNT